MKTPSGYHRRARWLAAVGLLIGGCEGISIAPSCPNELRVGETGDLFADPINPGAIAEYRWEVFPAGRGTFANASAPDTKFTALTEGMAVIRLTAADGLYQVVSECQVRVRGSLPVAVALTADETGVSVGDEVTLTCTDVGELAVAAFTITQTDGDLVTLTAVSEGVVRFEADEADEYTFRCVGTTDNNVESAPSFVTVTVRSPLPDNGNANQNENANTNDNGNANANDNDNVNLNANRNVNSNDNGS